ncbi:MAG: hypothetical protein IJ518_01290 [Clostridia bacterium]|nr:hypothetical protein [Clostridia bacterium]
MKNLFSSRDRIALVSVWAAAVLGILLLIDLFIPLVQVVLLLILFTVVVITRYGWHSKAARVISRILCLLLPGAATVLFITDAVLSSIDGVDALTILMYMSIMAAPILSWHLPAAGMVADRGGKYDGWVLRVLATCQLALAVLCSFGPFAGKIAWHWNSTALRVIWVVLTAVACVLCWICHWDTMPTPPDAPDRTKKTAAEQSSTAEETV